MTVELKTWPMLYKHSERGTCIWQIEVLRRPDGAGDIKLVYGLENGKKISSHELINAGKNIGRSNETTAFQQAILEAESRYTKQLERKGYGLTVEESATTRSLLPMLAHKFKEKVKSVDWAHADAQAKLDGFRCLASVENGRVVLRSRESKLITTMEHVADELDGLEPGIVLDGELYAHGMPFEQIASAVKRVKTKADHAEQIKYHLYDLMDDMPFRERSAKLHTLVRSDLEHVTLVKTIMVRSAEELAVCKYRFLEEGYEGAMLRHGKVGYEAGKRSASLLKAKDFEDLEYEVLDYKEGKSTHKGMAIFICKTKSGNVFDVTAPGTHEMKRAFFQNGKSYIGKMLQVRYQGLTTEDRVPRFPVAVRFVED
jgi:ATP-dependent DNA ligase